MDVFPSKETRSNFICYLLIEFTLVSLQRYALISSGTLTSRILSFQYKRFKGPIPKAQLAWSSMLLEVVDLFGSDQKAI